jgi:hypothetical protein
MMFGFAGPSFDSFSGPNSPFAVLAGVRERESRCFVVLYLPNQVPKEIQMGRAEARNILGFTCDARLVQGWSKEK